MKKSTPSASRAPKAGAWKKILAERLPLYGHRNWVVVADAAYPSQIAAGIETVLTGAPQIITIKAVLDAIARSSHIRPIIYTDAELTAVPESASAGVNAYRKSLASTLGNFELRPEPHENIIKKLDAAAQLFHVLILKTTMTIPYTSVFIELDCGYWNSESERRLRASIAAGSEKS